MELSQPWTTTLGGDQNQLKRMSAATAMTTIDDVDDTGDVIETAADTPDHIEEDPQPPAFTKASKA